MRTARVAFLAALIPLACARPSTPTLQQTISAHATWPWPSATTSTPRRNVARWIATTEDNTSLELIRFDFHNNSKLKLAIYDQDEDDEKPLDNLASVEQRGIGWVANHLDEKQQRKVVLAWNGLFFAKARGDKVTHIGPVVLNSKTHYNVGQHRWTFGVKYDAKGHPKFRAIHMPTEEQLSSFDFAADGAQCLLQEGKPLTLPPPGDPSAKHPRGGVASTPSDIGAIPIVDDIKTSRTSIGWSKDSRYFYVLFVVEPDTEAGSINAFRKGEKQTGGWTPAELQRFWLKLGVWGAINSDGGAVTQRAFLQPDDTYEVKAAKSGTLMSFYVSEG